MAAAALLSIVLAVSAGIVVPRSRATLDFVSAIRPPGVILLATGLAAEQLSGVGIVIALAVGQRLGPGGAWLPLSLGGGLVAAAAVSAGPLRRARLGSPADVVMVRWADRDLARVLHLIGFIVSAALLVPVLAVGAAVATTLAPISPVGGIAAAALVLLLSTLASRNRGPLQAQQVRLVTMVVGVVGAMALVERGRTVPLVGQLPALPDLSAPATAALGGLLVVGTIGLPQYWPRLQAADRASDARSAMGLAAIIVLLLAVAALAAGSGSSVTVVGAGAVPGWEGSAVVDRILAGAAIGGIGAGCVAAGSSLLLALTAAARRLAPGALSGRPSFSVSVAAIATVAAAGTAAVSSSVHPLVTLAVVHAGAAGLLTPVVVTGLWLPSTGGAGVRSGLLVSAGLLLGAAVVSDGVVALLVSAATPVIAAATIAATSRWWPGRSGPVDQLPVLLGFHRPGDERP